MTYEEALMKQRVYEKRREQWRKDHPIIQVSQTSTQGQVTASTTVNNQKHIIEKPDNPESRSLIRNVLAENRPVTE